MSKTIQYEFTAVGDIQDYIADPELVLKKFPNVISIEKTLVNVYKIKHNRIVFSEMYSFDNNAEVILKATDQSVEWVLPIDYDVQTNAFTTGSVVQLPDGKLLISGTYALNDPRMTGGLWILFEYHVNKVKKEMVNVFKANIENSLFSNAITILTE